MFDMWQACCINTNSIESLIDFVYLNSAIFNLPLSCPSDCSKVFSFSLTCEAKLYSKLVKKIIFVIPGTIVPLLLKLLCS